MPTVLITGTSTGIGLETALAAADAGWTTVATMRDLAKAGTLRERGGGFPLDVRQLDVTDHDAVDALVAAVVADHGSLDAVINNAGAGQVGTAETLGMDAFRSCMEVNYFGVVALTQAALPHLRASGGRLLTISSVGGVVGQPFNDAYCAAKFAVEGFLESLAPVAAAVGVSVVIVEPGAVASEFVANVGRPTETDDVYGPLLAAYLERTAGAFAHAQSADDVAALLVELLMEEDPPVRVQTSPGARAFVGAKLADLDGSAVQSVTRAWIAAGA
ncbi:SDR family NAD(P)-dependent oxidoreductase [Cellulomonas sp. ICMP 17802]|uniref:SDR family NAD(P)-dependent oxidoreductase n=1 Tax=Cellulomonas sp. ICMP 17802 TaxID=3239199 RepID=UPI00351B0A8B